MRSASRPALRVKLNLGSTHVRARPMLLSGAAPLQVSAQSFGVGSLVMPKRGRKRMPLRVELPDLVVPGALSLGRLHCHVPAGAALQVHRDLLFQRPRDHLPVRASVARELRLLRVL